MCDLRVIRLLELPDSDTSHRAPIDDILLWRLISPGGSNWKLAVRLVIFSLFSALLFNEGMNPMQPAPWPENVPLHLAATGLQIGWWLYGARILTVLLGTLMMQRVGHTGRLLQDLLGAVIFLIAIIAALAYVLDLPVKGVLATSGAVAIIVGLVLQSAVVAQEGVKPQGNSLSF